MTVSVTVRLAGERRPRRVKLEERARVIDLFKALGLNPQTVVARVNGRIVAEGERLSKGAQVELIPIVTGG